MEEPIVKIYGKLKNANVNGHVADTDEIYDLNFNETQDEINKKFNQEIQDAKNVAEMSLLDYKDMESHSSFTIYRIVDSKGNIQRIYMGDVLIFSEDAVANQGFPYTFPILL